MTSTSRLNSELVFRCCNIQIHVLSLISVNKRYELKHFSASANNQMMEIDESRAEVFKDEPTLSPWVYKKVSGKKKRKQL